MAEEEIKESGYEVEPDNSGVPKTFMIRCPKCRWARRSSGVAADLVGMHELHKGCKTCGKWRKFTCPKCGNPAAMTRIPAPQGGA